MRVAQVSDSKITTILPQFVGVSSFSREGRRPTGYLCVACGTRAQCPHSSNRCPKPLQAAQLSRDPGCWQVSAPSRPHPKGRERGGEAERGNKSLHFLRNGSCTRTETRGSHGGKCSNCQGHNIQTFHAAKALLSLVFFFRNQVKALTHLPS